MTIEHAQALLDDPLGAFCRHTHVALRGAATVTPEQAATARHKREQIMVHLQELIAADAVLCLPTSPRIAPFKNTAADLIEVTYRHQAMCLLCIAGLGGLPQVSLPFAMLDGLPLGLSLVGTRRADTALLELARVLGSDV